MPIDLELLATLASINAIGALGYYVTLSTGQLSVAHGAMFAIGAYAGGFLATQFRGAVAPALLIGFVAAALVGLLVGWSTARIRGLYFAVATLAFGGIVVEAIKHFPAVGGAFGMGGIPGFTSLPLALLVLAIVTATTWWFDRSLLYVSHATVRLDQDAAAVLGIDVRQTRRFGFAVGAGIAGVAGVLYAGSTTIVTPANGGFNQSLAFLLMVVIGGLNSWRGPILGAVIWTAMPELLRVTVEWRLVLFGVAAIILMIWRPAGLIPRRMFDKRARDRIRSAVGLPRWPSAPGS